MEGFFLGEMLYDNCAIAPRYNDSALDHPARLYHHRPDFQFRGSKH